MQNMSVLPGKDFWGNSSLAEWRPRHAQEGGPGLWRPGSIIAIFPSGEKRNQQAVFPTETFSVGKEANKPSSPMAAGAAIPDALCRADGAARGGPATQPPVTPTPVSRAVPADDKQIAGCFRDVVIFLESH